MYEIGPFEYSFKKNIDSDKNSKKIYSEEMFEIGDNEFVLISGPSGCGKSTLLQILKGIIPEFSSGELRGKITCDKKSDKVLYLFQNPFSQLIYPHAKEEFFFTMENFNYSYDEMEQKFHELKDAFKLDTIINKPTKQLSTGECQRLVLASLFAVDPEVILLDEPTAFLDAESRRDFYIWLKKIKGSKTIVIVDHHLREILPLVDKVIQVSKEGRIACDDKLLAITASPISFAEFFQKGVSDLKLDLNHLYFKYPGEGKLLEDLHLSMKTGDLVVIRGSNGKGKSTLFKIISGILKPTQGGVEIIKNGKKIDYNKHYKEIGFVFQNPESHFFYDTISEELKNVKDKDLVTDLMNRFFVEIDFFRSPFLLSEGEKRRLSILMILFLEKSIILYDEPTFGQDSESSDLIKQIICHMKSLGKIQLVISHDDNFIDSLGGLVYQLENESLVRMK